MKDLGWLDAEDALPDAAVPRSYVVGIDRSDGEGVGIDRSIARVCPRCNALLPLNGKWWWHVHFLTGGLGLDSSQTSGCFPSEVLSYVEKLSDPRQMMEAIEDFVKRMGSKGARYFIWYQGLEIDLGQGDWNMDYALVEERDRWLRRWGLKGSGTRS